VYWDKEIDKKWLENIPLSETLAKRVYFKEMGENVFIESYYFDNLKVDFGHLELGTWEQWCNDILKDHNVNHEMIKSISGFNNSIVLHGKNLFKDWKKKLKKIPDEVAKKMVQQNLGQYVEGCIQNQGLSRDDILFFYDAISLTLKKLLNILGGLNKIYFSASEPRWIESEIKKMKIKPKNMWKRINEIYDCKRQLAVGKLEKIISEVLELAEKEGIDISRIKRGRKNMAVKACFEHPNIYKKNKKGLNHESI